MALNPQVKTYLDSKNVDYEVVSHPKVFSTIEEARTLGIEADEIAKTLVMQVTHMPGDQALLVIPGSRKISNRKVHEIFATKHARLAGEEEMAEDFPDFELGAVPPLAELLNLPVYVDERLLDHNTVLFTGGTHTESIKMAIEDFLNLTDSILIDAVEEAEEKAA